MPQTPKTVTVDEAEPSAQPNAVLHASNARRCGLKHTVLEARIGDDVIAYVSVKEEETGETEQTRTGQGREVVPFCPAIASFIFIRVLHKPTTLGP